MSYIVCISAALLNMQTRCKPAGSLVMNSSLQSMPSETFQRDIALDAVSPSYCRRAEALLTCALHIRPAANQHFCLTYRCGRALLLLRCPSFCMQLRGTVRLCRQPMIRAESRHRAIDNALCVPIGRLQRKASHKTTAGSECSWLLKYLCCAVSMNEHAVQLQNTEVANMRRDCRIIAGAPNRGGGAD